MFLPILHLLELEDILLYMRVVMDTWGIASLNDKKICSAV
jgi:hypothetical protein